MKNKNFKKLILSKETVARLNDNKLERILGGGQPSNKPFVCGYSHAARCPVTILQSWLIKCTQNPKLFELHAEL